MKQVVYVLCVLVTACVATAKPPASASASEPEAKLASVAAKPDSKNSPWMKERPYVADEMLVTFAYNFDRDEARACLKEAGAEIIREFRSQPTFHLRLPPGSDVYAAVHYFRGLPGVVAAAPNYRRDLRK